MALHHCLLRMSQREVLDSSRKPLHDAKLPCLSSSRPEEGLLLYTLDFLGTGIFLLRGMRHNLFLFAPSTYPEKLAPLYVPRSGDTAVVLAYSWSRIQSTFTSRCQRGRDVMIFTKI